MVTDTNKMSANLTNPLILVTDQKISNINEILHLLEAVSSTGRPMLIIADDFDSEVVNTLVILLCFVRYEYIDTNGVRRLVTVGNKPSQVVEFIDGIEIVVGGRIERHTDVAWT